MTELKNAPLDMLLEELGRRPADLVKAALVSMPVPCMLLTCDEYEADLARYQAEIDRQACEILGLQKEVSTARNVLQKQLSGGVVSANGSGVDRFTSSCEVGTPSKGGVAKVYFDPANLEEAKQRAANALAVREFMMGGGP